MGQLIQLQNAAKVDIAVNIKKYLQITSTNGETLAVANNYTQYPTLCFTATWGTAYSTSGQNYLFPYASSDSSAAFDKSTITNQVGNCVVTYTANADNTGWIANITITGSELQDETVNSLLLVRNVYTGSGGGANAKEHLLYAYILDSPITLNAENNYIATLTLSVVFE